MSGVELSREGDVTIVTMDSGENRFHPDLLAGLEGALDDVEQSDGPAAVVICATGKFFSNGLDLDYLASVGPDESQANLARVQQLLARVLGFPAYTVAAIGGHCFAAGAMLSLACDHRVMRADRGFFCLPEVDLGMPFTPGMQALITGRLTPAAAHEAMVTGRRYGGADAARAGLVHAAVAEDEVLAEAVRVAKEMAGKPRATLAQIKRSLYAPAIAALAGQSLPAQESQSLPAQESQGTAALEGQGVPVQGSRG